MADHERAALLPRSLPSPRKRTPWQLLWRFLGPGYFVAVGYMDPGNWTTDIDGGASFGYQLLSVVLLSSITATVFQLLCIKLGLDLAEHCRAVYPRAVNWVLYVLAELAIIAMDLAEVVGSAIALKLLFGIPPLWGVVITTADVLVILIWWGERYQRHYEAGIFLLVVMVASFFIAELTFTKPNARLMFEGFIPTAELFRDKELLLSAIAILGATVMPHNLYLHSSICKDRQINDDELVDLVTGATADDEDSETDEQWVAEHVAKGKRGTLDVGSVSSETLHHAAVEDHHDTAELLSPSDRSVSIDDREPDAPSPPPTVYSRAVTWTLRLAAVDTIIALFIAFLINAFILIVGAAAFWEKQDGSTPGNDGEGRAHEHITGLDDAYMSLHDYVGPAAATLFAVALLASGQSSTLTGTIAGQIVMNGYLKLSLPPVVRRLVTRSIAIIPAIITILVVGESYLNRLIILTQVVLSFQLPFVLFPLVHFTSTRRHLGVYANGWPLTLLAWTCALIVAALNVWLVVSAFQGDL